MLKTTITFGTYDLLHIGHIKLLKRCLDYGDILIVGVSSDDLNKRKKNKLPEYSENDRMEIIQNIKGVDIVFLEESLEKKREYILKYGATTLIMGDDWEGKFDDLNDICNVIYLKRTEGISSSSIKECIKNGN